MRIVFNNRQTDLELGSRIGQGRDGVVYAILGGLKHADNLVAKIFHSQSVGSHVDSLISPIKGLVGKVPSLSCLPHDLGVSDTGHFVVIMKKATGANIDELGEDMSSVSKYDSLRIAYQIADGIRILHENYIIHSDIALDNIVVDTLKIQAFIIDIDGGGRTVPFIRPRIYGKPYLMAPELWNYETKNVDVNSPPDIHSDCWSLATLILYIVTGGSYYPFFFYCDGNVYRIKDYDGPWPPSADQFPDYRIYIDDLSEQLGRLGARLLVTFQSAFITGKGNPPQRPTAAEWAMCLRETGLSWAICRNRGCVDFGTERAASRPLWCPRCGERLRLIGRRRHFPIGEDIWSRIEDWSRDTFDILLDRLSTLVASQRKGFLILCSIAAAAAILLVLFTMTPKSSGPMPYFESGEGVPVFPNVKTGGPHVDHTRSCREMLERARSTYNQGPDSVLLLDDALVRYNQIIGGKFSDKACIEEAQKGKMDIKTKYVELGDKLKAGRDYQRAFSLYDKARDIDHDDRDLHSKWVDCRAQIHR